MEFTYRKNDNEKLFKNFKNENSLNLQSVQNYIPIYNKYFSLNDNNYKNINLNNKYKLDNVKSKINDNIFKCEIKDDDKIIEKEVFFKFSPLLDPTKYLIGQYDLSNEKLMKLPELNEKDQTKINNINNSAYVDGFFNYLNSQLLHEHNFINSTDYYGGFLAQKKNFKYNIIDDLEHLSDSEFFNKNNNNLFQIDNNYANLLLNFNTRKNKQHINLLDESVPLNINELNEINELDNFFSENNSTETSNVNLLFEHKISKSNNNTENNSDQDECSSTSSKTSNNSHHSTESDLSNDSSNSTASEDTMLININLFPVKVIALEKCHNTLDSLIVENSNLSDLEWGSMILQVILTLLTYQKCFKMTHNDLHSNNIMYIKTEKQFIYYKALGSYYKIPTFGRIYKIIDFGRAIYKFRGETICSDSYHKDGDAATLYNIEPFLNKNKPRLEPNYSFDLCRLGCSLLDFFIDELEEFPNSPDLGAKKIIKEWCIDDKGRNILYKKNMRERYPDFKLYKMIARTVHNHTPEKQLEKEYFNKFKISKKKIKKHHQVINIDSFPCYC